jgi:hypothetical protein
MDRSRRARDRETRVRAVRDRMLARDLLRDRIILVALEAKVVPVVLAPQDPGRMRRREGRTTLLVHADSRPVLDSPRVVAVRMVHPAPGMLRERAVNHRGIDRRGRLRAIRCRTSREPEDLVVRVHGNSGGLERTSEPVTRRASRIILTITTLICRMKAVANWNRSCTDWRSRMIGSSGCSNR